MKKLITSIALLILLSTTSMVAIADWTGCRILEIGCVDEKFKIVDIFEKVEEVNDELINKNRPVMLHYLDNLEKWDLQHTNAQLLAEGIVDILAKLPPVRKEFWRFVGDGEKCARETECAKFRTELIVFYDDISELKDRFPMIQRAGMADKTVVRSAIMSTPPLMLFALYRGLERTPDWQQLPGDLGDIFDEIDDSEVFDIDLLDSLDTVIDDSTKTQRFCAKRADKFDGVGRGPFGNRDGWDQIRVNRMTLAVGFYKDLFEYALGLIPDDIDLGAAILGEGATLGIPSSIFTWFIQTIPTAIDTTMKALEVHQNNIGICKSRFAEIEGRLSSCRYFSEFVLDSTARDEYYDLVQRRFDMADEAGISIRKSGRFYRDSIVKLGSEQYIQAYENLCNAYKYIGVAK